MYEHSISLKLRINYFDIMYHFICIICNEPYLSECTQFINLGLCPVEGQQHDEQGGEGDESSEDVELNQNGRRRLHPYKHQRNN